MIISRIYGGLGNQMFQYALGKKISLLQNDILKLDLFDFDSYKLRNFGLNKFNIQAEIASKKDLKSFRTNNKIIDKIYWQLSNIGIKFNQYKLYEKKDYQYYSDVLKQNNIIYYQGYWQSYKYFVDIQEDIVKDFSLKTALNKQNREILEKIETSNSISLHIRRGDYLKHSIYENLSLDYYHKSIEYMNSKVNNPFYFIFSDDITWVKENLQLNNSIYVDINDGDTAECDLELMKYCKHNIIANSSLSWWGAWLNRNQEKIIIAPQKWVTYVDNMDDLLPKEWLRF